MRLTTKILYSRNGQCLNCYSKSNITPYGSKWRVIIGHYEFGSKIIGNPKCIDHLWNIDQSKVNDTNDFLSSLQ